MSNIVRMLKECVVVFLTEAKRLFKVKYVQLQVQFSLEGQLESLSLDKFLLTGFKTITCHEVFLVT